MGQYRALVEFGILLAYIGWLRPLVSGQTPNSFPICQYTNDTELKNHTDKYPDVVYIEGAPTAGDGIYFNLMFTLDENNVGYDSYKVTLTAANLQSSRILILAIQAYDKDNNQTQINIGNWNEGDDNGGKTSPCKAQNIVYKDEHRMNYTFKWQPLNTDQEDINFRATVRIRHANGSEVYFVNIPATQQDRTPESSVESGLPLLIIVSCACALLVLILICSLCLFARYSYRKWKRERALPPRVAADTDVEPEGQTNIAVEMNEPSSPGVYQIKENWEAVAVPTDLHNKPHHKRQERMSQNIENTMRAEGDRVPRSSKTLEIPRSRVLLQELIGEGAFGDVYKADGIGITNLPITTVAVKILKDQSVMAGEDFKKELGTMMRFEPHPNVIQLLGTCTEKEPYFLVLEFAPLGDLRAFLHTERSKTKKGKPNPKQLLGFAVQIAKGMEYIVGKDCVHRDLATRNVLLGDGLVCKLSDFGLARKVDNRHTYEMKSSARVPVRWLAPESIEDNIYSVKSDVWSFGILCWELVTMGSHPYGGKSASQVIELVRKGQRLEKPAHCSKEMYVIMTACWQMKAKRRPKFTNLRQSLETMHANAEDVINPKTFDSKGYVYLRPERWENSEEDAPKRKKKPQKHLLNEYEFNAKDKD